VHELVHKHGGKYQRKREDCESQSPFSRCGHDPLHCKHFAHLRTSTHKKTHRVGGEVHGERSRALTQRAYRRHYQQYPWLTVLTPSPRATPIG